MRTDRLEALINFIETIPESNFNMNAFVSMKGSDLAFCAAGWLWKVDSKHWYIDPDLNTLMYKGNNFKAKSVLLQKYFEIPISKIMDLFFPNISQVSLSCTPKEWVAHAKKVLEELTTVDQMKISKPSMSEGFDDLELFEVSEHSSVILDELREDVKTP